jgi:tetratricopeptide (TPR) repeat protein
VSEFGVPLRSGRFDEALPIVRRHVERAITHRDAKLLRFIAWQIVAPWQPAAAGHPGLLAQAERAATQAIELAPEPDDAMFATLARVWFCKGDLQQALAWQQKAVDATIPQRTVDRQRHEATLADYWQRLGSGR